jgi:uncharacterized protein YciI
LEYTVVDNYLERRGEYRAEHLALAQEAAARGELVLAGALADPSDRALLVWRTDDRSVVEQFAQQDPYVKNGLVKAWVVRPWTVVVGTNAD